MASAFNLLYHRHAARVDRPLLLRGQLARKVQAQRHEVVAPVRERRALLAQRLHELPHHADEAADGGAHVIAGLDENTAVRQVVRQAAGDPPEQRPLTTA